MRVLSPGWIEEMLMYAQRPDVGAVGAKLYYRNRRIQHAGMILGAGAEGIAANAFDGAPKTSFGYMGRLFYAQDVSAVSGACMMVRKSLFAELGGFDVGLPAFGDIDFCLRLRQKGYLVVFTPYAELYHDSSRASGTEVTPEQRIRVQKEAQLFRQCWRKELTAGDPYYNPNFCWKVADFAIETWRRTVNGND